MNRFFAFVLILVSLTAPAFAAGIHPFVRGSWQDIRQAHGGQPLVVHFWGVTCGPCLVELPHWGELAQKRPDMTLILIAADPVPEDPNKLALILNEAGLSDVENWAFADDFVARLRYEIDPQWRGELPRTMLIGRDGTMKTIVGVARLDDIRAWLNSEKARRNG